MNLKNEIVALFCLTFLTACNQKITKPTIQPTKPSEPSTSASIIIACGDARPQMCTKEYRPVCGKKDTGVRCVTTPCPNVEYKTYGNACTACADKNVINYVAGECEE